MMDVDGPTPQATTGDADRNREGGRQQWFTVEDGGDHGDSR